MSSDERPLPDCPKCGSKAVYPVRRSKETASDPIPFYCCGACKKQFRRTTGTPLSKIVRRDQLVPFIRILSQQQPFAFAAEQLGIDYRIALNWTNRFREWLLELDPSGQMEAKVRLGMRADLSSLACPACAATSSMIHFGFCGTRGRPKRQLRCKACQIITEYDDNVLFAVTPDRVRGDKVELRSQSEKPLRCRSRRRDIVSIEHEIIAMFEAGSTRRAIAVVYKIDHQTVNRVIAHRQAVANGTASGPRKTRPGVVLAMSEENKNQIRQRRNDGEALHSLATAFGLSIGSIYKVLNE
jgi:transposase-like protein